MKKRGVIPLVEGNRGYWVILTLWLTILAVACSAFSIRWPWGHDSQVFHYIVYLLQHGFAPYREITDINLPGSYFVEWVGLTLFGKTDLGWRLFDLSILLLVVLVGGFLSKPVGYLPGVSAGLLFALSHIADGAWYLAERDQVIALLVLLGYAFAFQATRKSLPAPLVLSGASFALAASIKPTFIFLALAVLYAAVRQLGQKLAGAVYAAIGTCLVGVAFWEFLHLNNAVEPFVQSLLLISRFYGSIARAPESYMIRKSLPLLIVPVLLGAGLLSLRRHRHKSWERGFLCLGWMFCFLQYLVQGKGYVYHRYPFLALALVWAFMEIYDGLKLRGWRSQFSMGLLLFSALVVAPYFVLGVYRSRNTALPGHPWDEVTLAMMASLQKEDISSLSGRVQCLDTDAGCYSALFRLNLVQSTGEMGDHLLFWPSKDLAVATLRKRFLDRVSANPPVLFVLSNKSYTGAQTFQLLDSWPQFRDWLNRHYVITQEVNTGINAQERTSAVAYRIYRQR